jgi:hypothetical protein
LCAFPRWWFRCHFGCTLPSTTQDNPHRFQQTVSIGRLVATGRSNNRIHTKHDYLLLTATCNGRKKQRGKQVRQYNRTTTVSPSNTSEHTGNAVTTNPIQQLKTIQQNHMFTKTEHKLFRKVVVAPQQPPLPSQSGNYGHENARGINTSTH